MASSSWSPDNREHNYVKSIVEALPGGDDEGIDVGKPDALDGGLGAWLVVLGGFLSFCTSYGMLNSWGTFQAFYVGEWPDEPLAKISWIGSLQAGLLFLLGGIVGPAFDRWGARPLMLVGTITYSTSFLMASLSSQFWHCLLTQGLLLGVGNAFLFYPTTCSITEWFHRKRGLALGIAAAGSSFRGIFWPMIINDLLHVVGLSWTLRIIGFVSLPPLVAACILIRARKPKSKSDHAGSCKEWAKMLTMAVYQPDFLALTSALFFVYLGFLIPFNYIPLYAETHGTTSGAANVLLAMCYTGSVIGRISTGWAADRLGGFNILAVASILSGILILYWVEVSATDAMTPFAYGLSSGGLIPLGAICVTQISPDMKHIGLRISAMMALCSVGVIGGGPLSGFLLDSAARRPTGYLAVFVFSGVATLVGGIFLVVVRLVWGSRTEMMYEENGYSRKTRQD